NTRLLWSYIEIGRIFIVTGRIDEARTYFQYCLEIENRVGYIRGIEFAYHYLGEISGCEKRQDEAIEYYKKAIEMCSKSDSGYIQKPLLALANIYYIKGDYEETVKLAIDSIHPSKHSYFSEGTLLAPLNQMEMAYNALGMPKKFIEDCNYISETLAGRLKESYFQKWYLEPDEISESLSNLFYADDFDTGSLNSSWKWIDKFGDSNYKFNDQKGLKIYAANGRDFLYYNSNVPRLMQEFSGNFAVEVCVSPVSDQKPQMGGLLIWKDEGNFLHLETGVFGKNEIHFNACINWEGKSIGRGILPDNSGAFLRIERTGDRFYAYCSIDRKNWMTCGSLDFHLEDPIQVGIHAMGMIDRTIYCDAFKEGTGTLFREFRIWNDPD
ncbi:DUF1349 domain-containing protein, partial [Candidatus Poribacteria bacterium]|nr:DUF1349 domain-containing protein [Candidatus Poribacteria bacterium]